MDELESRLTVLDTRRGKERVTEALRWCQQQQCFDELVDRLPASVPRRRGSISWILARAVIEGIWSPTAEQRERIVILLDRESEDAMTKRGLLDIFQYSELPEKQLGTLTDTSIRLMRDPNETTGVRAFAITVLFRIVDKYPELYREVQDVIAELSVHDRPAIRVRANRAIRMMQGR